MEWRNNPSNPYYGQYSSGSSGSGYGTTGDDEYGNYLMGLINSNPGDPKFQDSLFKAYLDYMDPRNQKAPVDENKLNAALSMMSSDDPADKEWGRALIAEVYGKPTTTGVNGYGAPQSYEDLLRSEAKGLIADPGGLDRDTFDWNRYLANSASNEQIRRYDTNKPTIRDVMQQDDEDVNPMGNAFGGIGAGAAAGAGIGSIVPVVGTGIGALAGGAIGGVGGLIKTLMQISKEKEEMRRRAAGYTGYSY